MPVACQQNKDQNTLVREGTSQDQRVFPALNPAYAPVDERNIADRVVFAQSYAALLNYFDATLTPVGDWTPFFSKDVSAQLALIVIEDIEVYKTTLKSWFDYLNNRTNELDSEGLKQTLAYLYSSLGTLALRLDAFKESLPVDISLKSTLQNMIKSQLAPAFKRLISYYKGGVKGRLDLINESAVPSSLLIMRSPATTFDAVLKTGLSLDWSAGEVWFHYIHHHILPDVSVYGDELIDYHQSTADKIFIKINHCATHSLFTSIFDQFLHVFARIIIEAKNAFEETLTKQDNHQPHFALFLAFLRLFEYVRSEANTLTARHLEFYYREILRFKEKPGEPGHAYLLAELAKHADSHDFKAGELFKAGKDDLGKDAFFANERDFIANKAKVSALKTVYRHGNEEVTEENPNPVNQGRIYASPVANSDDGLGAKLLSPDQSWHPFFNKVYADGTLQKINMPAAETGFAIASHYLLMAGGTRTIKIEFRPQPDLTNDDYADRIICALTTEKGWLTINQPKTFKNIQSSTNEMVLGLEITLTGAEPAITPYLSETHGYNFGTDLPVLLVRLKQDESSSAYTVMQNVIVETISLGVNVDNLKLLAVSNDFGPVDTSKPFQPFGPSPVAGNALIIGSKEVFQKKLISSSVSLQWLNAPKPYPNPSASLGVNIDFLNGGQWPIPSVVTLLDSSKPLDITGAPALDKPDFTANEFYSTSSRHGFVRIRLASDFGQEAYQEALFRFLRKEYVPDSTSSLRVKAGTIAPEPTKVLQTYPGTPPVGPTVSEISLSYHARQEIVCNSFEAASFEKGRFFHVGPFGTAEQSPYLNSSTKGVHLLPQFNFQLNNATTPSEAELYIGISELKPPQNLSLLFQIADGTANPLADNPKLNWSYLKNNQWVGFAEKAVEDGTGGFLNSGIMTFAVPQEATQNNTLFPANMIWIRAAVQNNSDAVCKLKMVAAQALKTSFVDKGNSPGFQAKPIIAETISKLVQPDATVKTITQPFASFGGRGAEQPESFNLRISERLRHKDRAITLWDYERLILEAFPQIHKVKCLNHTYYEKDGYSELAPGNVTIVTIPDLQLQNLRDPLKPYTSLGLLDDIGIFLKKRVNCFTRLHVQNPRFEEVLVSFRLSLYDGFDKTYYRNLLQQAITRFLSPWVSAEGGTPSFGGKIYKSVLINFIEEQPYVDYVTDFELFWYENSKKGSRIELPEVEGSTAISILVSAPADKHDITFISFTPETASGQTCSCKT